MIRCKRCDDLVPSVWTIDSCCVHCADRGEPPAVDPATARQRFKMLDAFKVLYGIDVGDPDRDWSKSDTPDST